ncbi:uncharacterized protein LOC123671731 [Harmonia axyridis]|uniref:uncharacterized protein LOC123671731 n=1 Tax=Harmonia axyridis TaxID=115357 RepID=UPI001E27890B|nr:uncharacterized protein LOC123671731 [Harmonia axyridis]
MPKVRPRTTNKANWTMEDLQRAIKLIVEQNYSIRNAAKTMNIPFASLYKRYKKKFDKAPRLGHQTVFTPEMEKEFADIIKKMANIFYGCTPNQIKRAAFEYAEALNLKHDFNKSTRLAGRVWFEGFIARNNISVRKPEATSINRVTAFNKTEVGRFYNLLEELMEKYKFLAKNIYNCDETGISTVQEPERVLTATGQKRVGSITSWERGKNITMLCAMSAGGGYVPPMFIFPRKRMTPTLEKDGPTGAIYKCSDNGWINEELFLQWLKHFTQYAKPSAEEPILLILDNHASHSSLAIFEYCKENYVHMLSLPPHTSHRMQPLDVSFFGPFKAAYRRECDLFMKSQLLQRITPYDVASLVKKAFSNVASMSKAEAGFKATGIFPINSNVFSDEDLIAAEVLQSEPIVVQDLADSILGSPSVGAVASVSSITATIELEQNSPIPSTSTYCPTTSERVTTRLSQFDIPSTSKDLTSVQNFIQMPKKVTVAKKRQGRQKQHATILTSTPIKDALVEKENKKKAKALKTQGKGKGIGKKSKPQEIRREKVKKKILQDSNDTSMSDVNTDELCQDDENDDTEDASNLCLVCGEFGRNNETWYRCTSCGHWAHADCTGWDSAYNYVCDMC